MKRAFTLIELLVVISIVSLLASLILSSLGSARAKANNSAINSAILEYAKAAELYRSTYGSYPYYSTPGAFNAFFRCLDNDVSIKCGPRTSSNFLFSVDSAGINAKFDDFIKMPPVSRKEINLGGSYNINASALGLSGSLPNFPASGITAFKGAIYRGYLPSSISGTGLNLPGGMAAQFVWMLEGQDQTCARPASTFVAGQENLGNGTLCMIGIR